MREETAPHEGASRAPYARTDIPGDPFFIDPATAATADDITVAAAHTASAPAASAPAASALAAGNDDATNARLCDEVAAHDETGRLGNSIEVLKEMAFHLLQEVKALSHTPATDVKRGVDFYEEVRRFEIDLITRALEITDGHQSRAARLLNLKITTLNSMMKRYGIAPTPVAGSSLASFAPSAEAGTTARAENEADAAFAPELHNRAA